MFATDLMKATPEAAEYARKEFTGNSEEGSNKALESRRAYRKRAHVAPLLKDGIFFFRRADVSDARIAGPENRLWKALHNTRAQST